MQITAVPLALSLYTLPPVTQSNSPSFISWSFRPLNGINLKTVRNHLRGRDLGKTCFGLIAVDQIPCVLAPMCLHFYGFKCLLWNSSTSDLHTAALTLNWKVAKFIHARWNCPLPPEIYFNCPQSFRRTGRTRARPSWRAWPLTSVTWAWLWLTSPKERTCQLLQWRGSSSRWDAEEHGQCPTGARFKHLSLQ